MSGARGHLRESFGRAVRAQLPAVLSAIALVVGGGLLISRGTPLWWFGASALVGAVSCVGYAFQPQWAELAHWLGRERRFRGRSYVLGTLLLDLLYSGVLIWVATVMMRDLIFGVRPISHDHTVHYFKAWQLREDYLPRLRLHGFSHRWFAGYPVNYLYPIGTDLFVNLVDLLGFGLLSFPRAYGVAFWLFHAFTGLAGYRLGRTLGGPHVGLLSGFLLMTDLSAFRFGGWAYTIEYGVWPQALSLVFALLATVRVPAIFKERTSRPIGVFALWMGAAIITHPIELIYLGLLLFAAVLAGLFSPDVPTARGTVRLLVAYVLSGMVAAVWLLPFLSSGSQTTPMGVWWDSTYELGKGLITLETFPGTIGYVLAFGVLACVLLLRSRDFTLLLTVFMALLVPAASNSSLIDELHLPELAASFAKVQWLRMATMAKPFWFAMTAYVTVLFLQRATRLLPETLRERGRSRSLARDVIFGMVVAQLTLPFVVQAGQAFFTSNIAKSLTTESDRARDTDREHLVSWLQQHLPHDGFYRVCISTGHNHDLLDIGTLIEPPIYKRGFTPAENFIYKMNTEDDAVLQAVNVRYMVVKKWLPAEKYQHLAQFGIYQVYEYKLWQPQPFVITQGSGSVTVERFEGDEIVLRAAPGSHGKLRLNVSYFPRWHAYHDGQPISLWPSALLEAPNNTGFMTVWLEPGEYRFRFELSLLDRASAWLSTFAVACAFVLVLVGGTRRRGLERGARWRVISGTRRRMQGVGHVFDKLGDALAQLSTPRFALLRRSFISLVCAAGLVAVIALAEWRPPLVLEELNDVVVDKVRFDFLEQLTTAHVWIEYPSRVRRCRRLWDRFACRTEDGNIDNEKYVASTPAEIEEYRMVRCIRARPEENARLEIEFPDVPTGDAIVGYFGIERSGRMLRLKRPVDFLIEVDGQQVFSGATTADNKMHWFNAPVGGPARTATVRFSVSSNNVYRRFFCFYAQMADLREGTAADRAQPRRRISTDDDEAR